MRRISSSPINTSRINQNGLDQQATYGFFPFATKAFIATAAASTSYAAYYCATLCLFSSLVVANGDGSVADSDGKKGWFKEHEKKDDKYGIEYVGFDSYLGAHPDDGIGMTTTEFKATAFEVVSEALEAAGLDEKDMMKSIAGAGVGGDTTLHPNHAHRVGLGTCPSYGCPFLPMDVHYEEDVKTQLQIMRKDSTSDAEDGKIGSDSEGGKECLLNSSGSEDVATLTLIGYKGGRLEDQINQDRSLALIPFLYWNIKSSSSGGTNRESSSTARPVTRLIGSFDGHARFGEKVSEYVVKTLPALLGSKLVEHDARSSSMSNDKLDQARKDQDIVKILHDTFLELDATSPADPSGGCTASVVLQIRNKIYIANSGDSRSFVIVHIRPPAQSSTAKTNERKTTTAIIYGTREDKPHLSMEQNRIERMGGSVYLPNGFLETGKGTTRVLYQDPSTGSTSGLAMSRSIGDWDAGEVGVIADPLIDILDINEIKARILGQLNEACEENGEGMELDPVSGEVAPSKECVTYTQKNVKIFAISATDGLLDYLPEQAIANHVAKGLYDATSVNGEGDADDASHLLLACEDLIYAAAQGWQEDKGGRYRDDITIAVTDLEID